MPNINDIILRKKKDDEFFNVYRPIEEVGGKIFDSFKKIYTPGKGFPLSQKDMRYGTLSNILAISTLLELESMDINIAEFHENFCFLLKTIFDSVYKNGDFTTPIFDASPYLPCGSDMLDSYVETAAKILIVMFDLRDYAYKNDLNHNHFGDAIVLAGKKVSSFFELANMAEKLLVDAICFLNESVLTVKEKEIADYQIENNIVDRAGIPSEIKFRGWTFCNPLGDDGAYSTSIYYTYHVTNAYISLYNAYPQIFEKVFGNIDSEYDIQSLNEVDKALFKKNEEFILKNKTIIDNLRVRVSSSGRYIEKLLSANGVDIALDFVKSDFTKISFSEVINTQEKNAAINTLFTLAIFLNAGLDDDYEFINANETVMKNKDWFYNQLQFAISNVKKLYNVLHVSNKQELIDSFSLHSALLNDKYPSTCNALVQQLRKGCRNVAVYDLIPLLCNTYSNIFKYMIKYPQLDMVDNLEMIMENCSNDNEWLWGDVDGFNVNNNLYYIFALENFYDYYENYEAILTGNKKVYNRIVKEKQAEYENKIQEERDKNKELEDKIKQLENVLSEKKSNLDKEVEVLAKNTFESLFDERFTDCLDKMLTDATMFYIDSFSEHKTAAQSIESFKDNKRLRVALALYSSIDFGKVASGRGADFTYLTKYDSKGELTRDYLSQMNKQINESIAENVENNNKGE